MVTLARSTIQHTIRIHSQACYMSYQLWHIHISLPWCSQPNRNREMEVCLFLTHPYFLYLFPFFSASNMFPLPSVFCYPFIPSHSLDALIYSLLYRPNHSVHLFSLPFFSYPLISHFLPSILLKHPLRGKFCSIMALLAGAVKASPSGASLIY